MGWSCSIPEQLGHLAESLAHDKLVIEASSLVPLLCFGCFEDHHNLPATGSTVTVFLFARPEKQPISAADGIKKSNE